MNLNTPIKFDHTRETLSQIASKAATINKEDIEEVKETVKALVKARGVIQKQGKSMRDEAIAHNKQVLSDEKELVGIIEPTELEYKQLIADHEHKLVLEARKALLPMKKKQIEALEHRPMPADEDLLNMDDEAWVQFYAGQFELNEQENELIKERAEREKQAEEDKAELVAKMEAKAEEDKARAVEEERQRADRKKQQEQEDQERAEQQKKKEEELAAQALAADTKYQDFLKENEYNTETDIIKTEGDTVSIYRLIATLQK